MRQYSIDRVQVSWLLLDLTEGIAARSSIAETRNNPSWTVKQTGYGKIVRVFNPDRSGQITIQIDQESETQQQLRFFADADAASRASVGDMIIADTSSGEIFTYGNAFIMTEPDEGRGTESLVFPWVWHFETFIKTIHLGLTANVVGN